MLPAEGLFCYGSEELDVKELLNYFIIEIHFALNGEL